MRIALAGNPNSGKTTTYNALTGRNERVGNWAGVTVEKKEHPIKKSFYNGVEELIAVDLPGAYSMSPFTSEESVTRDYIKNENPDAIINIVDATNIERNLYLTMQLLEMNIPVVVALNMMDEMTGNHGAVDVNTMEKMLGTPVVPISAAKNEGVDELISHAIHVAKYQESPGRTVPDTAEGEHDHFIQRGADFALAVAA